MGLGWKGRHPMDIAEFYVKHREERAALFPPEVKLWLVLERMLDRTSDGLYYGRAQNAAIAVRAAYDRALEQVDVLVMPTVAARPPKLPPPDVDFATSLKLGDGAALNTPQFDLTGHPAISVPCGKLDGLPIGMMIVGRIGDEATVLRAGMLSSNWANALWPIRLPRRRKHSGPLRRRKCNQRRPDDEQHCHADQFHVRNHNQQRLAPHEDAVREAGPRRERNQSAIARRVADRQ